MKQLCYKEEKREKDRIDFDRSMNSCKYTYGTVHKLDQTIRIHKTKFFLSLHVYSRAKKRKNIKKNYMHVVYIDLFYT
jgi:hypothetical protein